MTDNLALHSAITNEAYRKYRELVAYKMKEIKPKYQEDPRFKRAKELLDEIQEIESKQNRLIKEYHNLTGDCNISNVDRDESIIMKLSKLENLNIAIKRIVRDRTEIEMSIPGFNPNVHLRNLEEFFKEELSYIK